MDYPIYKTDLSHLRRPSKFIPDEKKHPIVPNRIILLSHPFEHTRSI